MARAAKASPSLLCRLRLRHAIRLIRSFWRDTDTGRRRALAQSGSSHGRCHLRRGRPRSELPRRDARLRCDRIDLRVDPPGLPATCRQIRARGAACFDPALHAAGDRLPGALWTLRPAGDLAGALWRLRAAADLAGASATKCSAAEPPFSPSRRPRVRSSRGTRSSSSRCSASAWGFSWPSGSCSRSSTDAASRISSSAYDIRALLRSSSPGRPQRRGVVFQGAQLTAVQADSWTPLRDQRECLP